MLDIANTVLIVVDVQGRLAEIMHGREVLYENLQKIIRGAKALQIPIVVVEQNPDRMGPTVREIRDVLTDLNPIAKLSFSCCGEPQVMERLRLTARRQVLLAGIETHVCIAQTAADLVAAGYEVEVVADAVSSRTPENKAIGLDKIKSRGIRLTSVENILFELLRTAAHPAFKEILKIVK